MFIVFDGIDGGGKSLQSARFAAWLRGLGAQVTTCRDPGTTPLGEALRHLLLHAGEVPIHPRAEMLVYMAARSQLVEELIRPALAAGGAVVSDRFLLANVAYQAYGGGLNVDAVRSVGEIAVSGLHADLTFVLDLPVETALGRLRRGPDRLEARGAEYLERVRRGFLAEAARRPGCVVIDASASPDEVHARVISAAQAPCQAWLAAAGGNRQEPPASARI